MSEDGSLFSSEVLVTETPTESAPESGSVEGTAENSESLLSGESNSDWFVSEGVKGEGDKPDWFVDSKYKTISDQAKGYNELRKVASKAQSAPDDGYQLELADDLKESFELSSEDPLFESFSSACKDSNLSNDSFNKVVNAYLGSLAEQGQAYEEQQAEYHSEQIESLGQSAQEDLTILSNWGKNSLSDEEYSHFRGMVSSAADVRVLQAFMKKQNYATGPGTLPNTPQFTREELQSRMSDPKYYNDPGFQAATDAGYSALLND